MHGKYCVELSEVCTDMMSENPQRREEKRTHHSEHAVLTLLQCNSAFLGLRVIHVPKEK
jgi:hypothetical protein